MGGKLVVSLLPGATEMVAAVGALDQLVGISHECDWPPAVRALPRVTTTPIDVGQTSRQIDHQVRQAVSEGRAVIGIDADLLRALAPDVIITQRLCDVCAVADGQAVRLAAAMDPCPEVLVLSGTTLAGIWQDIRAVGATTGHPAEADELARRLEVGVAMLLSQPPTHRPRIVAIEWLDPLFVAGHWVPEMIAAAGGIDVAGTAGAHSTVRDWADIMQLDPDIVFIMLCGFDDARARRELDQLDHPNAKRWLAQRQVAFIDGNAYTSRPGPRVVEGIQIMKRAMNP